MRLLIILPLLSVAFGSPIVKRTKEVLIFGNQQNGPKVKKSDPNMPANADLQGVVRALDAVDLPKTKNNDVTVTENKDDSKEIEKELLDQVITEQKENDENNEKQAIDSKETDTDDNQKTSKSENDVVDDSKFSETAMAEITPEQENSLEELQKASETSETDESDQTKDKGTTNDADDSSTEEGRFENPSEWYQNPFYDYKDFETNPYSNYPEELLNYYDLLGRKRRNANKRVPSRFDVAVKRSRRIKRDLPDDLLVNPYYLSESEYPYTSYVDEAESPYVYSPEENNNIENYLELLDEVNNADPRMMETKEFVPTFDLAKRVIYNGEPGYFVPVKRQAYSYEPQVKRDQYFYPFSEEPYTHYSAFVPEKRDYADTYESLLRLARKLGRGDRGDDVGYEWQEKK